MKCPNCGYEQPKPEPKPYEYTGYLKEYLPTILKLLRMGQSPGEALNTLRQLHGVHVDSFHGAYGSYFSTGAIRYIRKRYGIKSKDGPTPNYSERNAEIVRRYNSETISMRKLGAEFGISAERVRGILWKAERKTRMQEQQQLAVKIAGQLKDVPLEMLAELPVRVINCFKNMGCTTIGEALKLTDAELLRTPNFGQISLNDWKFHLSTLWREYEERELTVEERA